MIKLMRRMISAEWVDAAIFVLTLKKWNWTAMNLRIAEFEAELIPDDIHWQMRIVLPKGMEDEGAYD